MLALMASSDASLVTSCIALGLVFLLTLPAIIITVTKFKTRSTNGSEEIEKPYEDEDGSATEASSRSFSAALPIYLTLGSTVSGLGLSTATAIQSTARTKRTAYIDTWLVLGCWVSESVPPTASVPLNPIRSCWASKRWSCPANEVLSNVSTMPWPAQRPSWSCSSTSFGRIDVFNPAGQDGRRI